MATSTQVAADTAAEKAQEVGYAEDVHLSDDDRDEQEEDDNEEFKGWDEGGKSDCGYRDSFHDTLMSIGASIHKVVGEPSERIKKAMKGVGNWFQEASYAARDFKRGEMNIREELNGSNEEEEEVEEEPGEEGYEEKLETVAEESSKTEE
jgi:hypothetical protein